MITIILLANYKINLSNLFYNWQTNKWSVHKKIKNSRLCERKGTHPLLNAVFKNTALEWSRLEAQFKRKVTFTWLTERGNCLRNVPRV